MTDYVNVIYNEKDRPFTPYPSKLINYIIKKYKLDNRSKILEIGCGRGEWINQFIVNGFDGYGCDISTYSFNTLPEGKFIQFDILKDPTPYEKESFDIIFTKSFIEHFYYPEKLLKMSHDLLKKNGILITLTPEWKYHFKDFYDDYTHRTPFTKTSLKDIHLINNFRDVNVQSFKQLPSTWAKFNFLSKAFSEIIRILMPDKFKTFNKYIKFSKEIMLISYAKK